MLRRSRNRPLGDAQEVCLAGEAAGFVDTLASGIDHPDGLADRIERHRKRRGEASLQ